MKRDIKYQSVGHIPDVTNTCVCCKLDYKDKDVHVYSDGCFCLNCRLMNIGINLKHN